MTITDNYDELLKQARTTATAYLVWAVSAIDEEFGVGYAKAHPQLVAAYMDACGKDYTSAQLTVAMQELADKLESALSRSS